MIIETISTFPHMFESVMGSSMMRIASEKGYLDFRAHDLRDWTYDRHRTTDDDPYGGGQGLVMKCEPIFEAVESVLGLEPGSLPSRPRRELALPHAGASCDEGARKERPEALLRTDRLAVSDEGERDFRPDDATIIFLAPTGRRFDDAVATELSSESHLVFVCGHYEGIDERAYVLADKVLSLGDYVLTSGELASMVVIDAVVRKIPGVLGAKDGAIDESFNGGLLEYPQYTRPATFRGMSVPDVLLSGDHAKIAAWRREQSLRRTKELRPDLLEAAALGEGDREFLKSLQ